MKNKKLIIHIGTPRAASTSLQKVLINKNDLLQSNSIYYGDYTYINYVDSYSHHNLLWAIADEIYRFLGMSPLYDIPESATIIADKIITNAEQKSCTTVLLSCELFFYTIFDSHLKIKGVPVSKEQIDQAFHYGANIFKSLFRGFDIKVICYIRRQDLLIESWFNQFVKESSPDFFKTLNGDNDNLLNNSDYKFKDDSKVPGFDRAFRALFGYTDYYRILSEWASAYGRENIIVRPFEKRQLDGDIVQDFFKKALAIEWKDSEKERIINARLDRDALEYLLRLQIRGLYSQVSDITGVTHTLKTDNLYMSLSERNALMNYHTRGNEAIARDYLHREDGILFQEEIRQEEDTYAGLTEETIFHITRDLIQNNNGRTDSL